MTLILVPLNMNMNKIMSDPYLSMLIKLMLTPIYSIV